MAGAVRKVALTIAGSLPAILAAPTLWAQGIHFGVKAGVPLTAYFDTGVIALPNSYLEYSAATRRYTLGVSVEGWMSGSVGVEGTALYHRMGYVAILETPERNSAIDIKGNSWDFPLIVKYRFGRGPRLHAGGGGVLRYVGPLHGTGEEVTRNAATGASTRTPLDTRHPIELHKRFYPGLTALAGTSIVRRRLRLLPEIRYTRWTANIASPDRLLRFAPNQAELMIGIVF